MKFTVWVTSIITDHKRFTNTSIDLIFTNTENFFCSSVLSDYIIFDHFTIYFTIRCKVKLFSRYKKKLEITNLLTWRRDYRDQKKNFTTCNRILFNMARKIKRERNWKYIWIKEGTTYVRKDEGSSCICIRNEEDLCRLN